jgi:histidinol dehydrogenase
MIKLDYTNFDFPTAFTALVDDKREAETDVREVVASIIKDVRQRGDAAVVEYTQRFDKCDPQLGERLDIDALTKAIDPELLAALDLAAQRIEAFHKLQLPPDIDTTDTAGVTMGLRWQPIDAVGLYVPGGAAAYPSSVLMNAIPAKIAGVGRIVMVVPTPDGVINPLVIAAAKRAGVDEIHRIGGAQAVAALAYGTASIQPVDKIVGPGNAYVAEAKRQVFGRVGIDMIAGPSEIVVIADKHNDPGWIAIDLLSQAEHDAAAQAILITDDADFAAVVEVEVQTWLAKLSRESIARASWDRYGAIITVPDLDIAAELSNRLAPEHLELAVKDPEALAVKIRHAGAMFLGAHTPEAIGDYIAGPNHVLPTGRSARFSSGLAVYDFMKRTTWAGCSAASLQKIGPAAVKLAYAEGLEAHALSISVRLAGKP